MQCPDCAAELVEDPQLPLTFTCPECSLALDLRGVDVASPTPPFTQPEDTKMPTPSPVQVVPPEVVQPQSKVAKVLALARKVGPGVLAVLMALEGALTPGTVVHGLVSSVVSVGKMLFGLLG